MICRAEGVVQCRQHGKPLIRSQEAGLGLGTRLLKLLLWKFAIVEVCYALKVVFFFFWFVFALVHFGQYPH